MGWSRLPPFAPFSVPPDKFSKDAGALLEKASVRVTEGVQIVTVDIDLPDDSTVCPDRDNNLRSRFDGAGQIPRVGCDVIDDNRLALGHGGSADSFAHRYANMFGRGTMKGSEHQKIWVQRIEHVEADPVVVWQTLRYQIYAEHLNRVEIGSSRDKLFNCGDDLRKGLHHGSIVADFSIPSREPRRHHDQVPSVLDFRHESVSCGLFFLPLTRRYLSASTQLRLKATGNRDWHSSCSS